MFDHLDRQDKRMIVLIVMIFITIVRVGPVQAAKINDLKKVEEFAEMTMKRQKISVEAGEVNLGGTHIKGLQYAGKMSLTDKRLWVESIQELLQDIEEKNILPASTLNGVTFTVSPYRYNGLAGVTHTKGDQSNIVLTQDIKGIPSEEYRKEVMKETIAHEIGHVIYNNPKVRDSYISLTGSKQQITSTTDREVLTDINHWANSVEERFAEDVKVYIIKSVYSKDNVKMKVNANPQSLTDMEGVINKAGNGVKRIVK